MASSSLRLVGILFVFLFLLLLLVLVVVVVVLSGGEEEALLAVVVPERSSSLLSLSLTKSDLVKRLNAGTGSSSSGGSGLGLSGATLSGERAAVGGGDLGWSMERVMRLGDDSGGMMMLSRCAGSASAPAWGCGVEGVGGGLGPAAAIKASTGPGSSTAAPS